MEPTSHTQEANFIRGLELIVGREEIVRAGLYDGHIKMRDSEFSKIVQEYENISIEQLEEYFKISRYDDTKIDEYDSKQKDESKKLRIKLERFENEHPELVDRVAEIRIKYDRMDSEDRYESLDLAFNEVFMSRKPPVDFKILRNMLDNIYSLQIGHKLEPNFYRRLYSENWSEFLNDDDWKTLLGVENLEGLDLEQINQEGIDIYGTGVKVKSYAELIEPITTYIRENNLQYNTNDVIADEVDLTQVIETQNEIIQN